MSLAYTEHLRADGERMAVAAARDLEAHVPTCPRWIVATGAAEPAAAGSDRSQ